MKEEILKKIAFISRNTPSFRGKYRVGRYIHRLLMRENQWRVPEFFITLKDNTELYIDARSETHCLAFWIGMRDEKNIQLILDNIEPNAVVLDVGANIGYYSIPIANRIRHQGEVHAFEPVNSNYASLEFAVERNNLKNIKANNIALGAKEGSGDILLTEAGNSSNAVITFGDDEYDDQFKKETISITTLDIYMEKAKLVRVDFIKIDIEGSEIFFFQGGMKCIEAFTPVIYGEFNPYFIKKYGFTVVDVWKLIKPLGYTAYIEDPIYRGKYEKADVEEGMVDLLFLHAAAHDVTKWTGG